MGEAGKAFSDRIREMEALLRVQESFDVVARRLVAAGREAVLFFVDGFAKDEVMEKILEYIMSLSPGDAGAMASGEAFAGRFIPYVEVGQETDPQAVAGQVLAGQLALLLDGLDQYILIDARTYPARGVEEPDSDRVLRGSHDGFVETLVFNTALIRRRIRSPQLTMEIHQVGAVSGTDVVLCYMADRVDPKLLDRLRQKLQGITIPTLTMAQESLAECLVRRQWFNPFPKTRYTERPDCAAASVAEGRVVLLVDNSAAAMILPTSIFDFVQDTNDYYFPPLIGTYLRFVRTLVSAFALFLTPVWYLLVRNPDAIPQWLAFIQVKEPNTVPLLLQLLIIELIIDGIKLASLNTPNVLNNAFGLVGALILGEFAVGAGLFVPEVLLYMAFVAIANFTQPSYELGYALKLFRMLLLVLIALFNWWGFAAGVLLMAVTVATTRTVAGGGYLYPLIPYNGKALRRLLVRRRISEDNTR